MKIKPWWKGKRGEWYVAMQVGLFLLVALGPRALPGLPAWSPFVSRLSAWTGAALISFGLVLIVAGGVRLGSNLTALPYPKDNAELVATGVYALVRHPMYSGAIFAAFGWALWVNGILTIGYAGLLFLFLDVKSRREERWLGERFPEYALYRKRVFKLIPLLY